MTRPIPDPANNTGLLPFFLYCLSVVIAFFFLLLSYCAINVSPLRLVVDARNRVPLSVYVMVITLIVSN